MPLVRAWSKTFLLGPHALAKYIVSKWSSMRTCTRVNAEYHFLFPTRYCTYPWCCTGRCIDCVALRAVWTVALGAVLIEALGAV